MLYAIDCNHVSKSFTEKTWWSKQKKVMKAVNQVSFQVKPGEIFGLLGPNGSGKSTLIRMLATLLVPDQGSITVLGHDVVKHPMAVRQLMNRVSVEAAFFKKLSSMENLSYAARLYGINPNHSKDKIIEILSRLGLSGKKLHDPIQDMSRGMQQKVAIARAFLTVPPVLLLDEPTTGLDPVSKRDVQTFVEETRSKEGTTVLLTTHDMEEADQLCDRIAIIHAGNIVALDTPEKLKEMVTGVSDRKVTLEDAFFELTGTSLKKGKEELCHVE